MDRLDEIKDKFKDLGVLAGADVVWLFMKIKDLEHTNYRQTKLIESYSRIIDGMISDAEEIKRLMLQANEHYTNNKDFEVNLNILKVLDMLQEIEA